MATNNTVFRLFIPRVPEDLRDPMEIRAYLSNLKREIENQEIPIGSPEASAVLTGSDGIMDGGRRTNANSIFDGGRRV